MKKILLVVSSLRKNGTETFLMNIIRNIDKDLRIFDFLIFDNNKSGYYEEAQSLGCKIFILPPRKKGFLRYHKILNRFFAEHHNNYQAIHYNDMSFSSVAPLYYAKKYGIPVRIAHIHGAYCNGLHNRLFHKINKYRTCKLATDFLGCSLEACNWGFKGTRVLNKAKIIPNGIDLKRFRFNLKERNEYREKLGLKEDELVLINIGNFNSIKNQRFIIDIVNLLLNQGKKIKLLLVGSGLLLEKTKEYTKELSLQGNIYFLGQRDDIPALLSASDIFVFPSIHEGLGIVAIEAQANGLPVIASTGVPTEAGVSKFFYRYDLNEGLNFWADKIGSLDLKNHDRSQQEEISKYSITRTLEELGKIYFFG